MKKRLLFLLSTYLLTVFAFIVDKLAFMLFNGRGESLSVLDVVKVVMHGLTLDLSTALYLLAIPFFVTMAFAWKALPRWTLKPYFLLIAVALALAFVADSSLYPFWRFKLDITCLSYLSTPTDAMASVSTGYLLLRILLIVVAAWIIYKAYMQPYHRFLLTSRRRGPHRRWRETFVYIALLPIIIIGIRGGISESTTNIGQAYFSQKQFLNHSAVNPVFSFFASFEKSANHLPDYHFMDDHEAQHIVNNYYNTRSLNPDTLLNTPRPNVVVVLMESCGGIFTRLEGRTDVMPRLNALMDEGISFDSCYANSWRTDRGTVCTYSGYPSFPTSSVMKMPSKTRFLPGLAQSLADEGYQTHYVYGGDINFTNMRSYLISTGFDKLTWKKDYPKEQQYMSEWGVHDHVTFQTVASLAQEYAAEQQPFFIGFSTLSSHQPWTVPVEKFNDEVLNAFYYLDQCIGQFVDSLRQTPLWQNLLVVLLPDHGFAYGGISEQHRSHNHIPMVWVGGAVREARHFNRVCNQTDLPATLLGQMGISHDDFCYSRDVMSRSYTRPIAVHTYNNAISVIDSTGFAIYDLDSRSMLVSESNESERLISVGKAVLQMATADLKRMK
jgi:phosphoglycerol transferase MdoB-like AlkP superfamily enzyme